MAISARLATARRTTLTLSLCAALAAGAGTRPADGLSSSRHANAPLQPTHGAVFAPFAAMRAARTSSDVHSIAVTGNMIPVTSCADDGSDGTLRKAIEGAADGDTIDMSGLACSLITLQSGQLVSSVPNLTLLGSGVDALTIDGNNIDRVVVGNNLTISDLTIAHGVVPSGIGGCAVTYGDLSLVRARLTACLAIQVATGAAGGGAFVLGNLDMDHATISSSKAIGADLAVGGAAIAGGTAVLRDSALSGNTADTTQSDAYGGALYALGPISLYSSTVDNNMAHSAQGRAFGGAIVAAGGIATHASDLLSNTAKSDASTVYGGAIHAKGAYAVSVLDASTISGNAAHSATSWAYGGGISSGSLTNPYQVTVVVGRSTISGNVADSGCTSCYVRGGGVHAADSISATYSTFDGNHATCTDQTSACNAIGGGLAAYGALLTSKTTLLNTTISANSADAGAQGNGIGGGMTAGNGSPLVANNSTIAFNHASKSGGGFAALPPFSTPSVLTSVIVANNDSAGGPDDISPGPFGMTVTIGGSNDLVMSPAAGVTLPAGTLPDDPMLQPLTTDEGGVTAVHPLGAGSVAIDAGANPDALGCDQRGFPYRRVFGTSADIGAYEFQREKHLFADNFDGTPACQPAP